MVYINKDEIITALPLGSPIASIFFFGSELTYKKLEIKRSGKVMKI
ncbi:hypothetical protein [Sporosarcina sp. 6E9]|nr:hypothetical protein [Sporosarcina sp. 6E9]